MKKIKTKKKKKKKLKRKKNSMIRDYMIPKKWN